jgi:streptomycin 6-kinase
VSAVPAGLEHLRRHPTGPEWLAALPDLVATAAQRWQLRLGEPFEDIYESVVYPATLPDGSDAVVKVQWPNRDNAFEAETLRRWHGDGAVRLLDENADIHALLLERCSPGTSLRGLEADDALDVYVDLLPRLWVPAGAGMPTLSKEAVLLSEELQREWRRTGRPFERRLVDIALEAFASLPASQGPPVLLHQDLHGDNVLRAERGWLAIDPKPLVGEREFGVVPIVRSSELGHSRRGVLHRFDRLTADLGLDRERSRLWTVAHTIAWSFEGDGVIASHVETARWLAGLQ